MRIAFAGTPEFAATALQALIEAGHQIVLVLTQPDRPAGRGMKLRPSPVKQLALAHGLPVAQPRSLRLDGRYADEAAAAHDALRQADPEIAVVAAYGLILPAWTLQLPPRGCLNIHASLLPRWRGAAPIHRAIEAGDARTGITLMQMDEGLDTGDMLLTAVEPIRAEDTTGALHDRLAALGGRVVVDGLAQLAQGGLSATPQPAEGITYAHKIDKAEAAIDWALPATTLARRIRAFDPFPGATCRVGDETVKLWQADPLPPDPAATATPGTVLNADDQGDGALTVACGEGALRITQVQRPGARRAPVGAWLRQQAVPVGTTLG